MIREPFKKSDYKPIQVNEDGVCLLMWGYSPITEKVYKKDNNGNRIKDSEGKPIIVSEEETEYCTCCHETVRLPKNLQNVLDMVNAGRKMGYEDASMKEWGEWVKVFAPESEHLDFLKERLNEKILEYGSSSYETHGDKAVDDFIINGEHHWLDKGTRTGLTERFNAELASGKKETTLWLDGKPYSLPLTGEGSAPSIKNALELYASECYDNTQKHVAKKNAMTTIAEVISHDWTTGYPAKLSF